MTVEIIGRQRFFDPGEIEFAQALGAADRLVDRKPWLQSVMISKPSPTALRTADSRAIIFRAMRLADLDLGAGKPFGLGSQRVIDQCLRREYAASRLRSYRAGSGLGAAGELPKRQALLFRPQIPECGINGGHGKRRDRADGGGMG